MKSKSIYYLFVIMILCQSAIAQQTKIDSLLILLKTAKEDTNKVNTLNVLSKELINISDYAKAKIISDEALIISKKKFFNKGIGNALNNIGVIYKNQGNYSEALKNHFAALKIRKENGDKHGTAISYYNIGAIYYFQGEYLKALENHQEALKIRKEINDQQGIANSYLYIGEIYRLKGEFSNALDTLMEALKIAKKIDAHQAIAYANNNIGIIYDIQGEYSKALKYYQESLKKREEMGDKAGIAGTKINIGLLYSKLKQYSDARNFLNEGHLLSKEIAQKEWIKQSYIGLSELDSTLGNWKSAYENYKLYKFYNDSIFNEESNKQITEMSTKYETEKKEAQIQLLEKDKEVSNAENKRQRLVIYSVSGGLLLLFILSGVIFKSLQSNRRKNRIITEQKQEVEKAKHIIEEKHKEQTDSINYAKRLQEAILPPMELVKKHLPDSFILYQPKDIVAGDFYWMEAINNIVFIAAADCTGHGVPGAMVSVVCSNALNRAVKEFGLRDTGKILDKVTDIVLETFEKSTANVQDGMDISLLAFNTTTKQIQWSGANNPLWYINNGQVIEIKANKQPIGKYDNRKPFTIHNIQHSDSSVFYLFTDGFADQFGGPKGKKYTYRRLEENILSASNLTMQEQENKLQQAFQQWKGTAEQIDDVTIIGIKL